MNCAVAAGVFLLAIGRVASAQPEPWVHPDGTIHYYNAVAVPSGINWTAAADSAGRLGGYLATLTSPEENDLMYDLVRWKPYWHRRLRSGNWAGPWLGLRQREGAPEPDSGWEWVTGETLGFDNWSPGQPNNFGHQDAANFGESPCGWVPTWNDINQADTSIAGFTVELSAASTTVGLLQNDSAAFAGYTLFESNRSHVAYLINNKGCRVHSWQSSCPPGLSNYLLEDGSLLHTAAVGNSHFTSGGTGGRVERLDWDGNVTWAFNYSDDTHCQHHDIEPLPNGHVLLLAWELKTKAEAIAAGRDPTKVWSDELWPDHLLEVDPATDSVVWEWHAWDHLIQDFDSTRANYGVVADHSELVDVNYIPTGDAHADWMHTNAVDYQPGFDQVLINVRDLGELWVIDHSTTTAEARGHSGGRYGMGGDLLYRWGNPEAYRAGSAADRKFYGQHDARWVEPGSPGAGNITIFNNGHERPQGEYSSVDEFVPACDSAGAYARPAPGTPFGPDSLCWTYIAPYPKAFYSKLKSGAQRLPNGNTLICESDSGFFFEVTPGSQVVWRYVNPVTDTLHVLQGDLVPPASWGRQNCTFRATRYGLDYPGFIGHDLAPAYPLERYSAPLAAVAEEKPLPVRPRLSVSPNPFRGSATITLESPPGTLDRSSLAIFDASGRLVRSLPVSSALAPRPAVTWDGRDALGLSCPPGVYICRLAEPGPGTSVRFVRVD